MIIGSILLILVAAALFGAGLYRESGSFYYSSIVISALAAFALVVGLRQARGPLAFEDDFDLGRAGSGRPGSSPVDLTRSLPPSDAGRAPRDEPPEQVLSPTETLALSRLPTSVAVVDGRPRYHLPECLHLLGRPVDRLPVSEAILAGFTACGQCRPAGRLLADGTSV